MNNWDNLTDDEKWERNQKFKNEFETSDDFGCIYVKVNGRNSTAFISGATNSPVPLWDMFETGILPDDFDYGIPEFHKSAKPLDFLMGFSMAGTDTIGWFMSLKAKEVFEKFNLGYHRFYPFTATKNHERFQYFLLAGKTNDDASIDFPKSSFYFSGATSYDELKPTQCHSLKEYHHYMNTREEGNCVSIAARNIILNLQFDISKDILFFDLMQGEPFLSKRLIGAIIEHKLTGISVRKSSNVHLPA